MRTAYFDLIGGAAGDMLLGALLDAGAPEEGVREALDGLGLGGLKLFVKKELRGFLASTQVHFEAPADQPHRHLADILAVIDAGDLSARVADQARAVFEALAAAEAKVHGSTPQKVHFHEVGAVDSIADTVGVIVALDLLGVQEVESSPLPVCTGTTSAAHGRIPLPAPAVLQIAQAANAPIVGRAGNSELVTPTAASLLVTLAARFGPYPAMRVEAVGYGAGSRQAKDGAVPNVTRVVLGDVEGAALAPHHVCVLEANLDDQTPEQSAYLAETLLTAGALDVFLTPVQMKKGRPAVVLTAIGEPQRAGILEDLILRESTTLGVRRRLETRAILPRETVTVATPHGEVRVKVAHRPGGATTAAPEYDDCAARAKDAGVPFQAVYRAALGAWEASSNDSR